MSLDHWYPNMIITVSKVLYLGSLSFVGSKLWVLLLQLHWLVQSISVQTNNYNLQNGLNCLSSLEMCINLSSIVLSLRIPGLVSHSYFLSSLLVREGGDIGLFITLVPKVLNNIFLFFGLTTLGTLNLICWLTKLSVQTFKPLIVNYRRSNFVYNYWKCTSIYLPLSYPFRSLHYNTEQTKQGTLFILKVSPIKGDTESVMCDVIKYVWKERMRGEVGKETPKQDDVHANEDTYNY